ncbi:MAG TPA: methyltransferase type 12 [Alcaligenes faecalis]|nr:methyltransferase type 12 [Alcaligenes faecalis]
MLQSKVSSAARAFRDGDYAQAIALYKELGERLGHQFFAANLALCQSRLGVSGRYGELASLPVKQLRVAGVMDEFTFHSYDPECELLQLHPEHCIEQLEKFKPHILFIESAWQGFEQLWKLKVSTNGPEINACIDWCKRNGVPTLFWNKEDPVHFGTFIPLAKQVDYVFTTDIDCVPKYKAQVGHDQVYFLPFAAQPKTHNPIEIFSRKDAFNFAGSYYLRYPERQRDFAALIDAVKDLRPVDIYDRNADNPHPHYTFPDEYKPMILGKLPFAEIDKAYKGYRYGINMNTIKQSQTMFARRVFELLASNTVVVSNFSRGVRLLFGDLVASSDQPETLTRWLQGVVQNDEVYRKTRLLGLRKIMAEHTYSHRLAYIRAKLTNTVYAPDLPQVVLVAGASTSDQLSNLIEAFQKQAYQHKQLHIVSSLSVTDVAVPGVRLHIDADSLSEYLERLDAGTLVGEWNPDDHYGKHYLTDLALASTYSNAPAFGKHTRYKAKDGELTLEFPEAQYRYIDSVPARSGVAKLSVLPQGWLRAILAQPGQFSFDLKGVLAIDEFNYIQNGAALPAELHKQADDLLVADQGVSFAEHLAVTSTRLPAAIHTASGDNNNLPQISAVELRGMLSGRESVNLGMREDRLRVVSTLKPGQYVYLYARKVKTREEMNLLLNSQFELCCEGSLAIKTVFEFQDKDGKKISHQMNHVGDKHALAIPAHCTKIRFGLRIEGSGDVLIERLVLGSNAERPAAIICRSSNLVLTKQYPAYDDLYKYGFLHSRIRAYKREGQVVDIYRINKDPAGYREFEGIDVASGDADLLDATLATGQIRHVLVHILDSNMWRVLQKYLDTVRVTVWAHGSEIQAWQRRQFEFEGLPEAEVTRRKKLGEQRNAFWRDVLKAPHPNLHMVFVSKYFAEEVFSDLGIDLPKDKYSIIHNAIDTSLFSYQVKDAAQRKRVLSIRPYSARAYANDLSVKAVQSLSTKPFFQDLQFHFIGDGELFEDTVAPLREYSNVRIDRKFVTQSEIAQLHKENGVFLVPTRCDSQGVSRDEAMSSGLVPITNRVSAIPEFVDESCGILALPEDAEQLAAGIATLYADATAFLAYSTKAAERVRAQSDARLVIKREISLIADH